MATENITVTHEDGFENLDFDLMKSGIQQLVESLPSNNLTSYAKDQGIFSNQAQARILSAFLGALHYQIKNLNAGIATKVSDLQEHLNSNGQGTEIHEQQTESRIEYINACEVTLDSFQAVFNELKAHYKTSTMEEWQPYSPKSESSKVTAGSVMAEELIAKYQKA